MGKRTQYVAYYRVSTQQQGASGLGLEAQRESVRRFLASHHAGDEQPVAEFTEVESGKRSKNRPQLLAALAECKRLKATLVIAKLDRLARNVHFISGLMEAGVQFTAVDMPEADKTQLQMMMVFAEHEMRMISTRTKAALQAAKARGKQLGNKRWRESIQAARKAKVALAPAPAVLEMMCKHQRDGLTLRAIADKLNALGISTPKGSAWYASTVGRALAAAKQIPGPMKKGVYKGRKPSLSTERAADMRKRAEAGENKAALAREFGISRAALYVYLNAA